MRPLVLAVLPIAGVAGFENMNGEYVISKTPGASDPKFNTKWSECERPHLRRRRRRRRRCRHAVLQRDQCDHADLT